MRIMLQSSIHLWELSSKQLPNTWSQQNNTTVHSSPHMFGVL